MWESQAPFGMRSKGGLSVVGGEAVSVFSLDGVLVLGSGLVLGGAGELLLLLVRRWRKRAEMLPRTRKAMMGLCCWWSMTGLCWL